MTPGMKQNPQLSEFYAKAWGKKWPRYKDIIVKTDICQDDAALDDGTAGNRYGAIALEVPSELHYTYYKGISVVAEALSVPVAMHDSLIVRREYELLRDSIEWGEEISDRRGIVVTGQPGIGKTTFLLYLLLHRLEHKAPTAIQFSDTKFFIFNEQGAFPYTARDELEEGGTISAMLGNCWALVDSNATVPQPCELFQAQAKRLIQVSPPNATSKERRLDFSSTLPLVRKWGPSTSTIIQLAEDPGQETTYSQTAATAAQAICDTPKIVTTLAPIPTVVNSEISNLLFLRPERQLADDGTIARSSSIPFIPTRYLGEIFDIARSRLPNLQAIELFCTLSSSYTGWRHEVDMHTRMSSGGTALVVRSHDGREEMQMQPSTCLCLGMGMDIKTARRQRIFLLDAIGNEFSGSLWCSWGYRLQSLYPTPNNSRKG
ncbi:hypothetical protein VNI00_016110 [Paramarasmius palmivorus]|uniref:Uncharacterized protein n=1 Tax=Paramarasmius palmivorus TaxID=297713 RepID=A0AAW0BGE1_9AGAR